ncbi:hypothetical protein BGW41_001678 [Actinomortierella wolfii]|nr:hypothetical protein BGW41_001678 [Actinomortierella wolfii]
MFSMDQHRLRRLLRRPLLTLRLQLRRWPVSFGRHKRRNATLLIFGTYFIYHWFFGSHLSPPQERWNRLMNFAQFGQFGAPPTEQLPRPEIKVVLCSADGTLCSDWGQRWWSGEELRRDQAWLDPGSIRVTPGTKAIISMEGGREITLSYGRHLCDKEKLICQDIKSMDVQAQFSVNRLERFEHAMRVWGGPISVVIYLQDKDDILELQKYFEQEEKLALYSSTTLTIVKPDYASKEHLRYPINHLRNIGILAAPTDYIFVIDADFVPTTKLYEFAKSEVIGLLEKTTHPTAYVVPCVAIQETFRGTYPDTIKELQKLMKKGIAYITDPRAGHGPTGTKLFTKTPLLSNRPAYEVCFESQWEPYYIVDRRKFHPYYDERFKDQGGDKQSHALLLNAIGFKFLVIRDHFIYHMDHPKLDWAGGGLKQNQKTKVDFTYFAHYAPALARIFGQTYRWPRGCSQPLISSSRWDLQGLGTM